MTDSEPSQCLVSNVKIDDMPPVGPLPSEQLGLFFNTNQTTRDTSKDYLDDYIKESQQTYGLELKAQEDIKLDSGQTAILATVYGGHPVQRDYYLFIYLKGDTVITTSFEVNTNHKELALSVLKSIE